MMLPPWKGRLIAGLQPVIGRLSMPPIGSTLTKVLVATLLVAGYVLLEWVSFIHEYKGVPITPWNPGLGLLFAVTILYGTRYAVALFAGVVIAEIAVLRSNLSWPVILGIAAIMASGYGFAAKVVRDKLLGASLDRLHDVVLLLSSGVIGAALVALFVCLLLLADANLDLADVFVAARPLLIGDIIGIAVITPLTMRLALHARPLRDRISLPILAELLLFIAVITAILLATLGTAAADGSKLFYLLFLPIVVAAVRHGLDGACIGLAITQLALVGLLTHYGYDADSFTEFQLLMLILSATGLTVGVIVTERQHAFESARTMEMRLKNKEAEAAQAARFNLVNGMASALAHEINQPMTAARALARSAQHILRTPGGDLTRADSNLTAMVAQIDHAGGVVRHVRDFMRRGRPRVAIIDTRSMLEEALTLVRAEASVTHVHLELDAPADLPDVPGDRLQLQQVVLNLVRNSLEAIAGDGQTDGHIRVVARRISEPPRVEIGVLDNGPGIKDQIADHLFEPLKTSKEEGLGLGLPICVSIVESHGGRIWLHCREAGATELRFTLPLNQWEGP